MMTEEQVREVAQKDAVSMTTKKAMAKLEVSACRRVFDGTAGVALLVFRTSRGCGGGCGSRYVFVIAPARKIRSIFCPLPIFVVAHNSINSNPSTLTMPKFAVAVAAAAAVLAGSAEAGNPYPTVTAHGMGDSCFNEGMKQISELVGNTTGNYARCIPTGNVMTDTLNGFLMTMDKNVDVFAENIRKDPNLKDAPFINCVGFSQGNSLCRGYIHKYNDPPVANFLSVHGTVSGVAGFPNCNPQGLLGPVCKQLADLCGDLAYNEVTQNILFQVDYYRDPLRVNTSDYKKYSQIAQWNNEGDSFNQTYKDNFVSVKRFAMIKAMRDTMVFPNEGEWWGHFADGSQSVVLKVRASCATIACVVYCMLFAAKRS